MRHAVRNAASQETYRQRYIQTLSSSTPQQLVQKNWEVWKSFFRLLGKYRDPEDDDVTQKPSPPGYWKDASVRRLHTVIRNDQYTLQLGDWSRLEIPVGMALKEKYGLGHNERLRLAVRGRPHWEGPQRRLELVYDRDAESFTAHQPVGSETESPTRRDRTHTSLATTHGGDGVVAAVDIGANTLAAVTTSDGDHLRFDGRPSFERYRRQTEEIARLQSKLASREWSSRRIRRLYRRRREQRDHAVDALIRHLAGWLLARGVTTVFVGDLDDVLRTHWSVVNEKTHQFWAHGRFRDRLSHVLEEEYGITDREASEAGTSSRCPACQSDADNRSGDLLQCLACGFEGHSDVATSVNFLAAQTESDCRSMARPAVSRENTTEKDHRHQSVPCLQWDDHRWRRRDHPSETNEAPANRSTTPDGNLAAGGAAPG